MVAGGGYLLFAAAFFLIVVFGVWVWVDVSFSSFVFFSSFFSDFFSDFFSSLSTCGSIVPTLVFTAFPTCFLKALRARPPQRSRARVASYFDSLALTEIASNSNVKIKMEPKS